MRSTKQQARSVATWPRIEVEINEDGTGEVRTAGLVSARLAGEDAHAARLQAIGRLTDTAAQLGRPVQASTRDPQGSWVIVVEPDGTVRSADPEPARVTRRAKKARTAPATSPVPLKREGADTPGRGVPPTGHGRVPRPPYLTTAAAPTTEPARAALEAAERDRVQHEQETAERERAEEAARREREDVERRHAEETARNERAAQEAREVAERRHQLVQARERYTAVLEELRVEADQGEQELAAAQVLEVAGCEPLRAAVTEAKQILAATAPADAAVLDALGRTAREAVAVVQAARAAVLDGREQQEAAEAARLEAERLAAEQARRTAAAHASRQAAERRAREVRELTAARRQHAAALDALDAAVVDADAGREAAMGCVDETLLDSLNEAIAVARALAERPAPTDSGQFLTASQEMDSAAASLRSIAELAAGAVQRWKAEAARDAAERATQAAAVRRAAELAAARAVLEVDADEDGTPDVAADPVGEGSVAAAPLRRVVDDSEESGGEPAPRRRLTRRGRVLLVAALVVALTAGGTVTWRSMATAGVTAAHAQWVDERLALTEQIQAAQDLLAAAAGEVGDDRVLTELQDAIALALDARTEPAAGRRHEVSAGDWHDAERDVVGASAVLRAAVQAVERERAAWALDQATAAWTQTRAELTAAIDEASSVVAATAGQVADDAVRQALAAAITAATQTRDAEVDVDDVDALQQAVTDAGSARDSLAGPVQAARDAQGAWVAEQERVAAAQAAAAAAAKPATAKPSSSGGQQAAAAPPAASTPTQGGAREVSINPGSVSSSSLYPGQVSVSASTSGVSGPVVVTIGGVSQTIGTGSGSFSGVMTGLPAGTYSWSVAADGLVVNGPGKAVVP
jgi:hypothetical protein